MSINDIQRYTVGFTTALPEGVASVVIVGEDLLEVAESGGYSTSIDGSKVRFYLKKKAGAVRPSSPTWETITITATSSSLPPRVLEREVLVRVI